MSRTYSGRKSLPEIIYYTVFSSAIGCIGMAATPHGIFRISLDEGGELSFRRKIEADYGCRAVRRNEKFTDLVVELNAYFSGRPIEWKMPFDLQEGTPFQRKVWRSLRRIPYGQTRSYQAVARSIGHPRSSRAVGGACGNNPIAVLIPCHRVISTDGQPGGFSGGLHLKQRLLALEQKNRAEKGCHRLRCTPTRSQSLEIGHRLQ